MIEKEYTAMFNNYSYSQSKSLFLWHINIKKRYTLVLMKDNEHDCAICLENLSNNEEAAKLCCTHMYHKKCIDEWFKKKLICPKCRKRATFPIVC